MHTINPKITTAGLALPLGSAITHIALGTALYAPSGSEVALRAEVARFPITSGGSQSQRQVVIGATFTDVDPAGKSLVGKTIGEIGFYCGNTLFCLASDPVASLFVKSLGLDIAYSYALDTSALPPNSVTVNINSDVAGMAALMGQHRLDPNAHAQYATQAAIQAGSLLYAADSGTVNNYRATYAPAITAFSDGMQLGFQAANANTGAATFSANGLPPKPLLGGAHSPLQGGEMIAGSRCIVAWHAALNSWILLASTGGAQQVALATKSNHALQFGQFAASTGALGIGHGLENDGNGNLRVKVPDASMRRTISGIQPNAPITAFSAALTLLAASHMTGFVASASASLTLPAASTVWNGYAVSVYAKGGAVAVTPNALDAIDGNAAGQAYTLLQGQSAEFVCDGLAWWPRFKSAALGSAPPLYLTTSQVIGPGAYLIDTKAGAISLTLIANPALGDSYQFVDVGGTWAQYPLTIARNGRTIMARAEDLVCNLPGQEFRLWYNGATWRLQ